MLQNLDHNGQFKDERCIRHAWKATRCREHYTDYLADLIMKHQVDTVVLFSFAELKRMMDRDCLWLTPHEKFVVLTVEQLQAKIRERQSLRKK